MAVQQLDKSELFDTGKTTAYGSGVLQFIMQHAFIIGLFFFVIKCYNK
jgi:hypothetical protein